MSCNRDKVTHLNISAQSVRQVKEVMTVCLGREDRETTSKYSILDEKESWKTHTWKMKRKLFHYWPCRH
jgi:hypothetical protein